MLLTALSFLLFFVPVRSIESSDITTPLNTTIFLSGYYFIFTQNQTHYAKGQTALFTVTIKEFIGDYCTNCVVEGSINSEILSFSNLNNGTYTTTYTFHSTGYYLLNITVDHPKYTQNGSYEAYISVPKLSLYVDLVGGTEYKAGEELKIVAQTKDDQGYPIEGATCKLTIWFPNNTKWKDNVGMTELENGLYYYNTTIPDVEGVYTVWVNASYGTEWTVDSQTFHVAGWAGEISEIKEEVEEIRSMVKDIQDTVDKIPGIRSAVFSLTGSLSQLGINFNQAFLVSLLILATIGTGSILSTLFIASLLKPAEKEEEEVLLF